ANYTLGYVSGRLLIVSVNRDFTTATLSQGGFAKALGAISNSIAWSRPRSGAANSAVYFNLGTPGQISEIMTIRLSDVSSAQNDRRRLPSIR
ncbi:MAG: hypothetical protein ACO3AG_06095, partial [Fluviibacter sp.]